MNGLSAQYQARDRSDSGQFLDNEANFASAD